MPGILLRILAVLLLNAYPAYQTQSTRDPVRVGSGPLDCVRFRSVYQKKHVFVTAYLSSGDYYRVLAVHENTDIPLDSAFRIERIRMYEEPLYYIKFLNMREYIFAGYFSTATGQDRLPIYSYRHRVNTTRKDDGVWGFEKATVNGVWSGAWYIRNVYYHQYLIASLEDADPPPMGMNARFKTLQLDRRPQIPLTTEHMFYIEDC